MFLLLQQRQTTLELQTHSDLLLTLSDISLCLPPHPLMGFYRLPLYIQDHSPCVSPTRSQRSLTPIVSSTKLFPVIYSVLQTLFPKPNYCFFSNRKTAFYTSSRASYLKLCHPSSIRDWEMPHSPDSYICTSVMHFVHHRTARSQEAKLSQLPRQIMYWQ